MMEGGAKTGRGGDGTLLYKQQLMDAGFTHVEETV
jgi:hypothetical protein